MVPLTMTVVALSIVIIEWVVLSKKKKITSHKEGVTNVLSGILTYIPIFLINMGLTLSIMFWSYQHRLFDLGFEWYVWVLAYIGYDFMSYLIHWLSHKVRLFGAIHSVHHSPKEMKTSVSFRGSFAEFLLAPHLTLWLPLLGFHPLLIIIVEGVGQLYGVPLHFSEHILPKSKFAWLRNFIITPSTHRLHHAKNDLYLDTNYGLTFSLWDKLFNTFQVQDENTPPVYGIRNDLDPENLLTSQTDEFITLWQDVKSAPRLFDKLKYLFMPPGWSHIDGGQTANQLKKKISL